MNKKKTGVEVHFSDKIQTHETFSCEEYERGETLNLETSDLTLDELMNMDILNLKINRSILLDSTIKNFYEIEDDCINDFGVYISESIGELREGDLLITIQEEDCLNRNALAILSRLEQMGDTVEVTLARKVIKPT
ncbi:uncharacterized protein LOC111709166 isoform X2 [Eurytemora carolleeae]|uniref:uncharacterized protein LOC111709166 isoform X2 n=1 Tax=Eurytemora carolleeae TaxID=1294199 RepID=UPI000C767149|nr:uncharacterized protein LOC111709166 isoform X2 [Eurytemora carolleeae]|eukprot:XP_023338543.1 uncharacterized protein LOC111709166 isoform X2 [Eurytemora affinis]